MVWFLRGKRYGFGIPLYKYFRESVEGQFVALVNNNEMRTNNMGFELGSCSAVNYIKTMRNKGKKDTVPPPPPQNSPHFLSL